MRRIIMNMCLMAAMLLMADNVGAQEERSKTEFRFNMGYDFNLKGGGGGNFVFEPEFGWNLTEQFYFGLATGLIADDGFEYLSIPALAHFEVNLNPMGSITPYVGLMGGYAFTVDDSHGSSCGVINPQVGIKVPIGKNTEFMLGVGYTHSFADGGGGDALGVKVGFDFGGSGRGLSDFFKKLDKTIEVEMYTGLEESYSIEATDHGNPCTKTDKYEYTNLFGLRYSLLFPIFDNFYLGPSLGIGLVKRTDSTTLDYESEDIENDYEVNDESKQPTFTAMLRAKYKIEQLTFAEKFYPFVQLEAGGFLYDYDKVPVFVVNPSIGLSYKVGGDNSLDLTLSYSTMPMVDTSYDEYSWSTYDDDYEKKGGSGCFRLALGFTW